MNLSKMNGRIPPGTFSSLLTALDTASAKAKAPNMGRATAKAVDLVPVSDLAPVSVLAPAPGPLPVIVREVLSMTADEFIKDEQSNATGRMCDDDSCVGYGWSENTGWGDGSGYGTFWGWGYGCSSGHGSERCDGSGRGNGSDTRGPCGYR